MDGDGYGDDARCDDDDDNGTLGFHSMPNQTPIPHRVQVSCYSKTVRRRRKSAANSKQQKRGGAGKQTTNGPANVVCIEISG
jgi:hypothetical protein